MTIEVLISPEKLTAGDLVSVYLGYCEAYRVNPNSEDVKFMMRHGLEILRGDNRRIIDHRPFMGAKFFAEVGGWQKDLIRFWGYTSEKLQKREYNKFKRSVEEYFRQKDVEVKND